jgi:tRNA nucleotidyltransferase/poly(A) polymerase
MDEVAIAAELLTGEDAYVVGGTVRDELLGRDVWDVDIACLDPEAAARALAARIEAPLFPLSERHGAWRVAGRGRPSVDFTPLRGAIEDDLARRDFTINAIARPLAGGESVDPFDGAGDLEARVVRAVAESVFADDPLRLLRAVRLEAELGFRIEPRTERLIRDHASLVAKPAGERILDELGRLPVDGWARLDDLGLLEPLGGSLAHADRAPAIDSPRYRLVVFLQDSVGVLPISRDQRRFAVALLRKPFPVDGSPRSIHRFRRDTEPWALEALAFHGRDDLREAVLAARRDEPAEPLLRGNELGLPPGPRVGALLKLIAEERAAGTISTREEALELVRRHAAD